MCGAGVGGLSWAVASLASGKFEPFDSGVGLIVNQFILTVSTAFLAWRYAIATPILYLTAAYLGMNGYAYLFGGSESTAWVLLGAIVSTTLLLAPMIGLFVTIAVKALRRRSLSSAQKKSH